MKLSERIKATFQKALAPTIVATLIFFVTYLFFGMENTMIGPFATLSFLRYQSMCNHYECMIKNFAIYIVMAVLAFFAVMNLPLCILINALALFWIAYILIDEYNPTNYFPAGMALIFFQIAPAHTLPALGVRIAALLATFAVVFLFVFILSIWKRSKNPLHELIKGGFENCQKQLALCENGGEEDLEYLHHELCDINRRCSEEIYSYNRASIRIMGKTNWYCRFILVFQIMNYLTSYIRQDDNMQKAQKLYTDFRNLFENYEPEADYHRLNFRIRKPDIRNFRLRFALRQIITLTPCLVFAWASGLPNAYWLVISVFFMMIPFSENTLQRVRQRVLGTIAGICICLALFFLFQSFGARIVIMTIANFLIYGANGYGATVAYITCSALALQTINAAVPLVLAQRLIYTLAGALIALIANKWIFPIRMKKQIQYLMEMVRSIRGELTELTAHTSPGDGVRRKEIDQRIIKSYMLSKRLESLHDSLPEKEQLAEFKELQKNHMMFLAEYLSKYMI